jgi:hypothetical protein
MPAHGFLQHVENRNIAADDCKLLMAAGIPRVIHAGVRLNPMMMTTSSPRMLLIERKLTPPAMSLRSGDLRTPGYFGRSRRQARRGTIRAYTWPQGRRRTATGQYETFDEREIGGGALTFGSQLNDEAVKEFWRRQCVPLVSPTARGTPAHHP